MINYVTSFCDGLGDTHGDFKRFSINNFPIQKELNKNDLMIILGDFGGIWDWHGESKHEKYWLDWLEDKPFSIAFLDGNHENYSRLNSLPEEEWNGGKTHIVRPHIRHLMRGQVFKIADKKIFTFGGASSHDMPDGILDPKELNFKEKYKQYCREGKVFRVLNRSWWEEENPTIEDFSEGLDNLKKNDFEVDYILAHDVPTDICSLLGFHGDAPANSFLQLYVEYYKTKFFKFYSGHYHVNKTLLLGNYNLLYEKIDLLF